MKTSDESAFPQPARPNMPAYIGDSGLTKREYAAIKAMQGIVSGICGNKEVYIDYLNYTIKIESSMNEQIVKSAILLADEILKQLKQP